MAVRFEKYSKSGSGHSFAKRHFASRASSVVQPERNGPIRNPANRLAHARQRLPRFPQRLSVANAATTVTSACDNDVAGGIETRLVLRIEVAGYWKVPHAQR
jgi:hypothetical protein